MADEVIETTPVEVKQEAKSPFNDSNWSDTPVESKPAAEPIKTENKPPVEEDEVFNEDDYIKTNWGFDSAEVAKNQIAELRALKEKQPEPFKFANEASEKYFNALKEGKEDDVWNYLNEKKRMERIEKMEIKTVNEAAEIIKADLQYKYKDLTPEEIERQFSRRFQMPKEPKQTDLQTDEDFAEVVADYKQKVKDIELDMIIEAKMARPEISKFKSDLVLPDIPKSNGERKPTQEELAQVEANQKYFQETFDREYKNFNGYTIKAKDGDVELPVSYVVSDEEKTALKTDFDANFDLTNFFAKRWFSVDKTSGKIIPNVAQTMDDLYLLNNRDKILQKVANEGAAQMAVHLRKQRSNININDPKGNVMKIDEPKESKENIDAQVEYLMKNG